MRCVVVSCCNAFSIAQSGYVPRGGREAVEGLEPSGEVVDCEEVGEMVAQPGVAVVMEAFDRPALAGCWKSPASTLSAEHGSPCSGFGGGGYARDGRGKRISVQLFYGGLVVELLAVYRFAHGHAARP